jgi:hypothetical protein
MISFDEFTKKKKKPSAVGKSFGDFMREVNSDNDNEVGSFEDFSKSINFNASGMSFDEFVRKAKGLDDDLAPVGSTVGKLSEEPKKEEEKERTWFQKSESDSVVKTILGSATDLLENIGTGVAGMGEKAVDALMYLSPAFNAGQQAQNNPYYRFDINEYRQQQESAQKFIEKDLYDEEKVAKAIISDQAKKIGIDAENHSVFGEKSDALAQSAGQLGATIALSPVLPWYLTTGLTSFGGEAEGALKEGAGYEQAGGSALITAGADILTEKLFGAISFGGKTLDDVMLKPLTEKIANKTVRTLTNLGIDAVGEGSEEVIASVFSNLGTALYKEDSIEELLTSEEAMDEYIESFIGGAVLGGGVSAVTTGIEANKAKKPAFTENEQKVIDKEVERKIEAQEKEEGKKLTNKEKRDIQEEVEIELRKGFTGVGNIESTLGGETYEQYKSMQDEETTLEEEIERLSKEDGIEAVKLKNEAQEKLDALRKDEARTQKKADLEKRIHEEVDKLTANDVYLRESYNEVTRKGQKFEADVEKYTGKGKELVQRAIDSGKVNNSNHAHDLIDFLAKIATEKDIDIDFTDTEQIAKLKLDIDAKNVNGYVDGGKITLNIQSRKALNKVVGHELTHLIEKSDVNAYDGIKKTIIDFAKTQKGFDAKYKTLENTYRQVYKNIPEDVFQKKLEGELVADLVGDYIFDNQNFVNHLSAKNPNVFRQMYEEIKHLVSLATAGSTEKRMLLKAQRAFEKAYRSDVAKSEGVEYALQTSEKNVSDRLSNDEWNNVKHAVSEYKHLNHHYEKSSNGDIIIPVNNKLIYTDANHDSPGIRKVIEFNSEYENKIDDARRMIYEAEKSGSEIGDTFEVIESVYGAGFVSEYNAENGRGNENYDRRTKRGKSQSDSYHASFMQERIRRVNETIGQVNSETERASSEDGAFFDAKNASENVGRSDYSTESEIQFSLSNDTAYMDNAINANNTAHHVGVEVMEEAKGVRGRIADRMNAIKDRGLVGLPEDIEGNTYIANSSYDGTEENTTICPRSLASEAFVDAVSEYLGRPLTVEEQIYISQDLQGRSLTPECTYCYVATDRKAYRAFLGEYVSQRDAVLQKLKDNPDLDVSRGGNAYKEFLNGRKDTNPMYSRFKMWVDAYKNGKPMIEPSHLANINKLMGDINSVFGDALKPQIVDAMKYAQSASWAKKRINYVAYNGHILKWKQDRINKLNSHYGLRMYSFSDFHPAFVLENMQMITDASVRGLKMLGYTKDTDFVEIFAPTGMNINVSTFGFDSGGSVYENNIIGASWDKAKELRSQYPNVGVTFVATNDTLVEWGMAQDWIDVVIPYHLVRTGAEVAKAFGYTNYTSESADVKTPDWKKGDAKYIAPTEHNNDKATYLEALKKNHLKPRFERFLDNPNYMKLVNECRQPASKSKPVQPVFNEDVAMKALAKLEANGYYQPIGGSVDRMYEIASEVAENMTKQLAPDKYSVSDSRNVAPSRGWNIYGSDIALEAPVQEKVEQSSKKVEQSSKKVEQFDNVVDEYAPLTEAEANERDAQQADRINTLDEAPPETEAPYYGEEEPVEVKDPFEDRDIREVGDRKQKAYMYENPEVKPFFQEEAKHMLGELRRSIKGQRTFNDQVYYDTNGESGWFGTTRETSDEIAYLLDEFKYTYADLEKGLNAIIEDNGKENNAISKRIEFMLDERLREGHTDFETDTDIPANEEYINLLREKQIVDYSDEAFEMWARSLAETEPADTTETMDDIAPLDEVQVLYSLEAEQQEKVSQVDSAVEAEETADTPEFSVNESYNAKLENYRTAIEGYKTAKSTIETAFDEAINKKTAEYNSLKRKDTNRASNLLTQIENLKLRKSNNVTALDSKIARVEGIVENMVQNEASWKQKKLASRRVDYHRGIVDKIKNTFKSMGFDFDKVLESAKNKGTFASVDNTPQRFIEKSLGYKEGQILNDLTVNKVAQNESAGIKWLNSYTDKKSGLLAKIAKEYGIKPRSKESASAQMYAEGFWVDDDGNFIKYGDAELAQDYPDAKVRNNIKRLAKDPRIRQIYDETLEMINASRKRNLYPEIPRRGNYFLHFREMDDTFSRLGIPFNPNDIRLKDLPTDINGMTADLKPGQPYFASAHQRLGYKTTYDLVGGVERYLNSAKNQIYHIDDIQTLRALRNYIADTYGQAHGLDGLDALTEEEAVARIEEVYNSHLSTFAKFLNEEANVLAGKTTLTDRGLEGVIGRRGIQFLDTVNRQVGSNMVGFNVSSALTNTVSAVQAVAKSNKFDATKALAQTVSNKISSIFGKNDGFVENSPLMIRRKGIEKLSKTPWESVTDKGYILMSAIDNISSEFIVRTKFNELTRKGMSEQQAHIEADKWASRILGDRSLGQQPQLYNSKMLGLVTKFQLEVRNQLDSQFYDTIQEAKVSNEDIENGLLRNMKTSAKVGATFFQLAVLQHLFGKAFESVAGYNPAFDIVEVLAQLFGFDDDEESEDTPLDNLEQGFLTLLGDLPYTSTVTGGGRIPISSALPIEQLVSGKDDYGNEKSRWDTVKETVPYYLMPAGYGQFKKTKQGLGMFSDEHPVAGSYTDSGNLRFPIEDTPVNRVRSAIFGQYASPEARDYFDNERSPLKEKQIQEYKDLELPIREYWDYREGLSKQDKLEDKFDYIAGLDLPVEKKNIMINNIVDRKEAVDLTNYDDFSDYEEFDFATKNPEKYEFLQANNISFRAYNARKDMYNWYYENPDKLVIAKAVTNDLTAYRSYAMALNKIKADKDSEGNAINGSAKQKKTDYINNLNLDYGQKIILYRSLFESDKDKDEYNVDIVEYLNQRNDISYEERIRILESLDMRIDADGTVRW